MGYPSEDKSSIRMKKSPLVVADLTGCAFHGGSLTFALQNSGKQNVNDESVWTCSLRDIFFAKTWKLFFRFSSC